MVTFFLIHLLKVIYNYSPLTIDCILIYLDQIDISSILFHILLI